MGVNNTDSNNDLDTEELQLIAERRIQDNTLDQNKINTANNVSEIINLESNVEVEVRWNVIRIKSPDWKTTRRLTDERRKEIVKESVKENFVTREEKDELRERVINNSFVEEKSILGKIKKLFNKKDH